MQKARNIFKKNPSLKYQKNLTKINHYQNYTKIFEIFTSYIDNKEYIALSNSKDFHIGIFLLLENKKVLNIIAHKEIISTIKYFFNQKDNTEYIISADQGNSYVVTDLKGKIISSIWGYFTGYIQSCLLVFPNKLTNNYVITSTNGKDYFSLTDVYILGDYKVINSFKNSDYSIYFLLSWYNKKYDRYYIIQLGEQKISINNLLSEEIYFESGKIGENEEFLSGFIYNNDDDDLLCSCTANGNIYILSLYHEKFIKKINVNNSKLHDIVDWNKKYFLVTDVENNSIKVIDLEKSRVITSYKYHNEKAKIRFIKKINSSEYGESLISSDDDDNIILWTI